MMNHCKIQILKIYIYSSSTIGKFKHWDHRGPEQKRIIFFILGGPKPGLIMPKKYYFAIGSLKTIKNQKVLEAWPPKSEVSKAKWGFWGSKKCFGSPKLKKWFSQKNPKSVICQNIGGGQGSGPSQPDVVGSLGSICTTISRNQEKDKYDIWAVFILRITVNGPFQINLK